MSLLTFATALCWLHIDNMRFDEQPAPLTAFLRHQEIFDHFIANLSPYDDVEERTYPITKELAKMGFIGAWKEKEFIFFLYKLDWPDAPTEYIVYDTKRRPNAISDMFSCYPNRAMGTYHIQRIRQRAFRKNGWYYWKYFN
jgi:hypothetical protein